MTARWPPSRTTSAKKRRSKKDIVPSLRVRGGAAQLAKLLDGQDVGVARDAAECFCCSGCAWEVICCPGSGTPMDLQGQYRRFGQAFMITVEDKDPQTLWAVRSSFMIFRWLTMLSQATSRWRNVHYSTDAIVTWHRLLFDFSMPGLLSHYSP